MMSLLFLVLFISQSFSTEILRPDIILEHQVIKDGDRILYQIMDLVPSSMYEVRVSYPATQPMTFQLKMVFGDKSLRTRDLLNIDKVSFQTNSDGLVIGRENSTSIYVEIEGHFYGATILQHTLSTDFSIVLETLLFGVPYPFFKILFFLVVIGSVLVGKIWKE